MTQRIDEAGLMLESSDRDLGPDFDDPPFDVVLELGRAIRSEKVNGQLTAEGRARIYALTKELAPISRFPIFVNDQRCALNDLSPGLPPLVDEELSIALSAPRRPCALTIAEGTDTSPALRHLRHG